MQIINYTLAKNTHAGEKCAGTVVVFIRMEDSVTVEVYKPQVYLWIGISRR